MILWLDMIATQLACGGGSGLIQIFTDRWMDLRQGADAGNVIAPSSNRRPLGPDLALEFGLEFGLGAGFVHR